MSYHLQGNGVRVLSAVLTVVLFLLFPLLGKLLKISWPLPFRVTWLLFIGASMYLGELHNFFYRFAWWDELIVALAAFFHFRGGARSCFGRPLELFIRQNPARFRKIS